MAGPNKRVGLDAGTLEALDAFVLAMATPSGDTTDEQSRNGFRAGRPTTDAPWLSISGRHLDLFTVALDGLMGEPSLQHVSRETMDALLWGLGAEANRDPDRLLDAQHRRLAIQNFVREVAMPLVEFAALFSLEDLSVPGSELEVGSVVFSQLTRPVADEWLRRPDARVYAEDLEKFVGMTVATTRVFAGDTAAALQGARNSVDRALGTLRFAIGTNLFRLPDVQLLFRRDRFGMVTRVDDPGDWRTSGELGFRPVRLEVAAGLRSHVDDTVRDLNEFSKSGLRRDIKVRVERAVHWMGASSTRESPDDRLVDLCTAVETFLATRADARKGEAIAFRSMLLGLAAGDGFIDPLRLFEFYERRSELVHGSALGVCGLHDCDILRMQIARLLRQFMKVALERQPAGFGALLSLLATPHNVGLAHGWLRDRGPKGVGISDYVRSRM